MSSELTRHARFQRRIAGQVRHSQEGGFTLVELLVVIGIIGLLITIALPAFSTVRSRAKSTATSATLSTLDIGINAFRADSQLGGAFPISYRVPSYDNPHTGMAAGKQDGLNGGELLAWALVGADLLGTPGFKNIDGTNVAPDGGDDSLYGGWTSDSAGGQYDPSGPNPPPADLYMINKNTGQPVYHRSQFVDPANMKLPKPIIASTGITRFEYSDLPEVNSQLQTRPTISFLDAFGQPILYYRANRTAALMAGFGIDSKNDPYYAIPPVGIFQLADNMDFTGANETSLGTDVPGMDLGAGGDHPLRHLPDPSSYDSNASVPVTPQGCFPAAIQNMNITAKRQPHNDQKFLLLSAGPDGRYGTGDDVANFPLNP